MGMTKTPAPKYLSRQEAALALGIDVPAVDRLISRGLLARYRIRGRYVRVPAGQVLELSSLPREWLLRC
ncbi:helix-turn-helix DNA-binding protein [Streptomyces phage Abt2graduatex2]|nr:helix-turn-helix DNA-binding protein [Streptomyces phage Abt2graduatex2]